MKKIITTLTAVTFALGLAAAAQAQVAKTPEKPAVQSTQTVQPQVAPKEAAKTVTTETVTTGDKTQTVTQSGDKGKVKKGSQEGSHEGRAEMPDREESRRSHGKDPRGREVIPGRQKLCLPLTQTAQPGLKKSPA